MSKYEPLWRYIQINCEDTAIITFEKAEEVADVTIDPDFQEYKKELIDYGFKVVSISRKHKEFEVTRL